MATTKSAMAKPTAGSSSWFTAAPRASASQLSSHALRSSSLAAGRSYDLLRRSSSLGDCRSRPLRGRSRPHRLAAIGDLAPDALDEAGDEPVEAVVAAHHRRAKA